MVRDDRQKALILLVDDHPENLQVLGTVLGEQYKIAVAENGRDALEFVKRQRPDLILLDIMLPDMDGFAVCQRLKNRPEISAIPIIFLTAKTETESLVKGFTLGAVDYVTKPFHHAELLARVRTHLTLQEQKRLLDNYAALLKERNAELHAKNAQLDETNAQLQALNASKDKFFAILAHDLNSPLSSVKQLTEFIVEQIEDVSKTELIEMLLMQRNSMKNLLALLENLLTWSRMQRGMLACCPQPIDVGSIIARNIELLQVKAAQKQITLMRTFSEQVMAYADQAMVDTIVRNLISNALKFTHSDGSVAISATLAEQAVIIAVADTGIGIAAKDLPKLFRLEAQYKRLGTAKEKGTGLGLILCKEFVEQQGGQIGINSAVGKGTTVTFTLPRPQNQGDTREDERQ